MTSTPTSGRVESADGTSIAFTQQGDGPPIVMVGAVMASRARTPQPTLPAALAARHTVFTYDRRGTGESGDSTAYDVARELEDMNTVIDIAGPVVAVYGFSSGATLALINAARGARISRLLLLEPPLIPDPDRSALDEARRRLETDRADARRWFDEEITGIPADIRAQFPPLTAADLDNAPSMLHELTFLPGTTAEQFTTVSAPTLLMASDHTAPMLLDAAHALGAAIPDATVRVMPGHWHGLADPAIVAAIEQFLDDHATQTPAATQER